MPKYANVRVTNFIIITNYGTGGIGEPASGIGQSEESS